MLFEELTNRTIKMAAKWQSVGFCHGVMNTDNMSILGLTIDYGPFAFMEHFDPKLICNHSDNEGRYRYEAQPEMCLFNLERLAESLSPFIPLERSMSFLKKNYWNSYNKEWESIVLMKLGLSAANPKLVKSFWEVLEKTGGDFTNTFRTLSEVTKEG